MLSGSAADQLAAVTALAGDLIADYTDLLKYDRLTRHPDLVAHDLDRLKLVTGRVRGGVRKDRTTGTRAPLPAGVACAEHTRAVAVHADVCDCPATAQGALVLLPECGPTHSVSTT